MSGEAALKHQTARHGERFRATLRGLMTGKVPTDDLEAEMGAVQGRLAGAKDPRSVYRFFFGAPRAGVPGSEIERDAEWALGELDKRWNLLRDR